MAGRTEREHPPPALDERQGSVQPQPARIAPTWFRDQPAQRTLLHSSAVERAATQAVNSSRQSARLVSARKRARCAALVYSWAHTVHRQSYSGIEPRDPARVTRVLTPSALQMGQFGTGRA